MPKETSDILSTYPFIIIDFYGWSTSFLKNSNTLLNWFEHGAGGYFSCESIGTGKNGIAFLSFNDNLSLLSFADNNSVQSEFVGFQSTSLYNC